MELSSLIHHTLKFTLKGYSAIALHDDDDYMMTIELKKEIGIGENGPQILHKGNTLVHMQYISI